GERDRDRKGLPAPGFPARAHPRPGPSAGGRGPDRGLLPLVVAGQLRVVGGLPAAFRPLRGGLRHLRPPAAPLGGFIRGDRAPLHGWAYIPASRLFFGGRRVRDETEAAH